MATALATLLAAPRARRAELIDPLVARHGGAERPLSEAGRIVLRIGVILGDIAIDGDDIHGDGVNVAARLQPAKHSRHGPALRRRPAGASG